MLQEARELQINAVKEIIKQLKNKDEITFKSPTGSGKTYMMADLMNQVLSVEDDVVFLVSSLSKGSLAEQNYEKFCEYSQNGLFSKINPYLITTETAGEEELFVPTHYNVYLLPRDLYKKNGKLMKGPMDNFLNAITLNSVFGGKGKKIYLIKDECHIATTNLDGISNAFFDKTINCSATPNMKRGQNPDVEITDSDAVRANLIKKVLLGKEEDTVADAIEKFEEIKKDYRNLLGVNPCLIIQISNKDKADYELNNVILPELNKPKHQHLKWMLIVNKESECDTNDNIKNKKLPVSKWKKYVKSNTATIDIIIFKMVVSEGWDIPRACMLYQMRSSQSKQLDEQVMGRVRRNPRLLDYETLAPEAKKLATTAWVWGILPNNFKKTYGVKLWEDSKDITGELKLHITRLKPLTKKEGFELDTFLKDRPKSLNYQNIFDLYRKLFASDNDIQNLCYNYADTIDKWWLFTDNIEAVSKANKNYVCDYEKSMELVTDETNTAVEVSLPVESYYIDNSNYVTISDWVWKRKDGREKFSFDSEAEQQWANILKDLAASDTLEKEPKRVAKRVLVGKANPLYGQVSLDGNQEPKKIDTSYKYLWGKNYLPNSNINFEYFLSGIHHSYPDFIMKDTFNRIHIFEVKSVNSSSSMSESFDKDAYIAKIEELKKCYLQASKLTGYLFYLPVMKNDEWYITMLCNGQEHNISLTQFREYIKQP